MDGEAGKQQSEQANKKRNLKEQKRDETTSDGRAKWANGNGCSRMPATDEEGKKEQHRELLSIQQCRLLEIVNS